MKFWNSMRFKIITMFVVVIIPLVAFLHYMNYYSISVVRNQIAKSYADMFTMHISQCEQLMEDISIDLWEMIYVDDSITTILLYPFESDEYAISEAKIQLKFTEDMNYDNDLDMLFLYIDRDNRLITVTKGDLNANNHVARTDYLKERIPELIENTKSSSSSEWQLVNVNEEYGLTKIVHNGEGIYLGTWVNMDNIMKPLSTVYLGEDGGIAALSEDSKPFSKTELSPKLLELIKATDLINPSEYHIVTDPQKQNKYLLVIKKTSMSDLYFIAVIPEKSLLMALPLFQRIISFLPYAILIILFIYLAALQEFLFKPMHELVLVMRENVKGHLSKRIDEKGTNELRFFVRTFNEMMEQIKSLKIDVYEEKLMTQRAEFKHLHAQIQPHFFANSLNTIYNLAFERDHKSVQQMARHLTEYYRFVTRTGRTIITLAEEIDHVRSYLEIQKFRFTDNLTYEISIPDKYLSYKLPALTIQPFVENSIKYGYNERNELLHIAICVNDTLMDADLSYEVVISDNGVGFKSDILEMLQSEQNLQRNVDEHIGVWNVLRRLRMYFGEKANIYFENSPEGGAIVRIRLVIQKETNLEEIRYV